MKKAEYIEKYGEEEGLIKWNDYLARERERYKVRKEQKLASSKVWYANNKEKRNNKSNEYYQNNRDKVLENNKKYREENSEIIKQRISKWQKNNREKCNIKNRIWRKQNSEKVKATNNNWKINNPEKARAKNLSTHYKMQDKKRGFDTTNNINRKWIIENIFTSECVYCGDNNWEHLGADRIDNTKPHTPDNVVCACGVCNLERNDNYTVEEFKIYRSLHPRACDIPKTVKIKVGVTGALKKRTV